MAEAEVDKKTTAKVTNISTHTWSDEERKLLIDRIGTPRSEVIAAFREEFPKFEVTDTAIGGRL